MSLKSSDIKNLSFEEAVTKLEEIVNSFESQQVNLEQAIADYTIGEELRRHCEKKLTEARLKVEKITVNAKGNITTSEFDA